MKPLAILSLAAALLVATAGHCQTARILGMGSAFIGVSDDASAWYVNPAGLSSMSLAPRDDGSASWQVIAGTTLSADNGLAKDEFSVGVRSGKRGFAAGREQWTDSPRETLSGFAYAYQLSPRLGIGGGPFFNEFEGDRLTSWGAGLMVRMSPSVLRGRDLKLGLVASDIFGVQGSGVVWCAGISGQLGSRLLLAADRHDLTNKTGSWPGHEMWNFGAEYCASKALTLRAGSRDGKLTGGLGVRLNGGWAIDAGHGQYKGETGDLKTTMVTVTKDF